MSIGELARTLATSGMLVLTAAALGAGFLAARPRVAETPIAPLLLPPRLEGPPVVRVFDDYECAACARFDEVVTPRLLELAGAGSIRLEYYHAPLSKHVLSALAASAVECAPPHVRALARRVLHEQRYSWQSAPDPLNAVLALAADNQWLVSPECMAADSTRDQLRQQEAFARRAGISSVPTVWLDDVQLQFRSYSSLIRRIEAAR